MGESRSADELARKLLRAADGVTKAKTDGVKKSAAIVKGFVVGELHGVTRLRGVGRKGARIGVRYVVTPDKATVGMTGPAQLIERDTKPHEIRPGRAKALHLASGDARALVAHHPGTHGKHPFQHGVEKATPLLPRLMLEEQAQSLKKIFG